MQTLVRKFSGLVDIQGWSAGKILARKSDNTGFEWVGQTVGGGGDPQVNSDWNATTGLAAILNKPSFATVSLTGSYADLTNKPVLPTQYTDAMADARVVAGISLKVDKVTGKALSTNDFTDLLLFKLNSISASAEVNVNADWNSNSGDSQILNRPTLSTVATTGNYNDLTNKPNHVPQISNASTDTAQINNVGGTLQIQSYDDGSGYAEIILTPGVIAVTASSFTAPTPTVNDASTRVATTAFVKGATDYLLNLLAPAKPANLSTVTLSIASTYTAKESTTGTSRTGVINNTTPTVTCSSAFYDGDSGTLGTNIDSVLSGSKILTTADNSGIYTSLRILTDVDPYVGQFGKQGFYKQLTASVVPSAPLTLKVAHTVNLTHSVTGTTPTLTFYCDNPATPTITLQASSGVTHTSGKRLSGIPCLTTGDTIQVSCTANNTVTSFYNSSQIIRFSGTNITTLNYTPGSAPASGATIASGTQNLVISSGTSAAATIVCTAYNSVGATGTGNISSPSIRVSTTVVETSRVKSGTTDMPGGLYGGAYDSTELLTANSELQLDVDGNFKYPAATNYSTQLPAGPNYTGIGTIDRYVTFAILGFSGTSRTINISGVANFGATALISGLKMWARVDGAVPTSGWVDLNAAYPGVGNPTNSGDAALVTGSSTPSSRALTFGSVVRTGTLYIRIALPSGSTKTFTGIS
jgi:hypothetical protein